MGLVSHEGRWRRPEAVADQIKADPDRAAALAEYELKRQKAAYTADAQWALGHLGRRARPARAIAKAHLTAVIRLDPSREVAWKKLGYKKHDGRWVTDTQLALEKADARGAEGGRPQVEIGCSKNIKAMLDQPSKREEAEAALVAGDRLPGRADRSCTGLRHRSTEATQAPGRGVAARAGRFARGRRRVARRSWPCFAKSAEARRAADRDASGDATPREYRRPPGSHLLRDPIKYEVRPVGGPGSPGVAVRRGAQGQRPAASILPPPAFRPGDTFQDRPVGSGGRVRRDRLDGAPPVRHAERATGHSRYVVNGVGYASTSMGCMRSRPAR